MARPTQRLITRDGAAKAALDLIDAEGLDAFTLPRLARRIGVNPSSLYHHFDDRNDILELVAQLIVREAPRARRPVGPDEWQDWLVRQSLHLRSVILRHRNAAPLLVQFTPRRTMTPLFEEAAAYLDSCGVPIDMQITVLDAIETLTIGAAIIEAMRPHPTPGSATSAFPLVDEAEHPYLGAAIRANSMSTRALHEAKLRTFLRGLEPTGSPGQ